MALGVLWGTALGDALGLPAEGMSARGVRRRFGRVDRHRLLFGRGIVSDDTEQAALLTQSLAASSGLESCKRRFRKALLGWFLRLPFGIGFGTLRACARIAVGMRTTGTRSAGNGAAMRAAILGAAFPDDRESREAYGRAIAEVTHRDPRAIEGALFVAELSAGCGRAAPRDDRAALVAVALEAVRHPELVEALRRAYDLAASGASTTQAVKTLGCSGYVVHSVSLAAFCFARFGGDPVSAIVETIAAGGDTDTNAAIVGAWVGALHGSRDLPRHLVHGIVGGPFGPAHLERLAVALDRAGTAEVPRYSVLGALLRNLALYPVILFHGLRRLLPPGLPFFLSTSRRRSGTSRIRRSRSSSDRP